MITNVEKPKKNIHTAVGPIQSIINSVDKRIGAKQYLIIVILLIQDDS